MSTSSPSGPSRGSLPYQSNYSLRPKFRSLLLTFLVHHNPFYLLSAFCMIAGCYALNGALDLQSWVPKAGDVWRVLVLLGTINLYEVLLIVLALFLIRGRGIVRDGRTLLLLQVVFLADLMFVTVELARADFVTGVTINALLLVLAWVKVAAVLWGLSPRAPGAPRFPVRLFTAVAVQLLALYAIPCLLAWFDRDGAINGRQVYAVWWIVGLLPAFIELQRRLAADAGDGAAAPPMRPRIGGVYVVAVFVSLLAHVGMMHWVYQVRFVLADAAPVLLGLAVATCGVKPSQLLGEKDIRTLRMALPAAAVAASLFGPVHLGWSLGAGGRFEITPATLAAAGAFLAYVYIYFLPYAHWALAGSAVAAGIALFGPTPARVAAAGASAWRWSVDAVVWVLPKTAAGWGVAAIAGAFAFLGIGAALSLSQGRVAKPETPAASGEIGGGPRAV